MTPLREFIAPLHGLRGIAALSVLLAHSREIVDLPLPRVQGSMGVMLFFALSGFLMAHLHLSKQPSRTALSQYALARFGRIYPLFAVVCIASCVIYYLVSTKFLFRMSLPQLFLHLAGLGAAPTLWTISTEFQFYAVFAILWITYPRLGEYRRYWMIVGCAGIIGLLWFIGFPGGLIAITGYLQVFLGGMLVAIILPLLRANLSHIFGWILPVGLLAYAAAMVYYAHTDVFNHLGLVLLVSVIVLSSVLAPTSLAASILSTRSFVWLGEVSFGIYLLHRPAMVLVRRLLPVDLHWALKMLCLLVLVGIMAHLAYVFIERPSRSWIRSLSLSQKSREQ